jgi:hypothetical protein
MNATIQADSLTWRLYIPEQALMIDRIQFPPGLDIDGLFLTTEFDGEKLFLETQK